MKAKPLSHASFDTVSPHGVVITLLHYHAQTMIGEIVHSKVDDKVSRLDPFAGLLDSLVLTG